MEGGDPAKLAEVAALCTAITSHPLVKTKETLDSLYALCKDADHSVGRRAILSLAQVLFDVLPDYAVRKYYANDNVSRDVRARRAHEDFLLSFARRFCQFCEVMAFDYKKPMRVRTASAKALSGLFRLKRQFNTIDHLAKVAVRLACSAVERLRAISCAAIADVFAKDPLGAVTLTVMGSVAATQTPNISVELLHTLLAIRVKEATATAPRPQIEDKSLVKELKEADILDDKSEQRHNQAATLEHLFGTVFRFLRETKSEPHFCEAMEVVRKFVSFINIDVVPQIVLALKQTRFSLRTAIIAAQTAASVCQSASLVVDLRDFYSTVYAQMYEALEDRSLVLELLALFELMSGEIDKRRTASFAKRLIVLALHSSSDVAGTVLAYIRELFLREPAMTAAVDFEFEAAGQFNILLDDPDFANGPAAKYWELAELANSPNKIVAAIAKELATLRTDEAVKSAGIRAAREKRDWRPRTILEKLDDDQRIFDVDLLAVQPRPLPKTFKVFDFPPE
jgi:nucleolar complex protein 3